MSKLSMFRTVPGSQKVFCFFIRECTEPSHDVLCMSSCMSGFSIAVQRAGKNYMASTLLFPPHPIWLVLLIARLQWVPLGNIPLLLPALCCQDNIPPPPPFFFFFLNFPILFSNHSDHKTLEEIENNFLENSGGRDAGSNIFYCLPICE